MSSQSNSDIEERVLTLEREYWALGALDRRLIAVEQGLAQLWFYWPSPTTAPTCSASFTGTLRGCNATGLVGDMVTIKDHGTGSTLGSVTTGSLGAFSGSVTITDPTQSIDVVIAVSRFTTYTNNVTFSCGSNSLGTITLSADSTHVCFTGCVRPVAKTLTVTSNLYGPFTATWNGSSAWVASVTANRSTGNGCPAVTGMPVTWSLTNGGACSESYVSPGGVGGCPGLTGTTNTHTGTLTSSACPPSFSRVYTMASLTNYSGSAHTLTWTE